MKLEQFILTAYACEYYQHHTCITNFNFFYLSITLLSGKILNRTGLINLFKHCTGQRVACRYQYPTDGQPVDCHRTTGCILSDASIIDHKCDECISNILITTVI